MPETLGSAPRRAGHQLATGHVLGPSTLRAGAVRARLRRLDKGFASLFRSLGTNATGQEASGPASGRLAWLRENDFVVAEALETLDGALPRPFLKNLPGLAEPEVERGRPRAEVLARDLVRRGFGRVEVEEVVLFLEGYQAVRPLRLAELWALPSFIRLAILEELLERAEHDDGTVEYGPYVLSLRRLAGEDWRGVVESLSLVHAVLREDPAGVYATMDFRTRDRYRGMIERVAGLVKHQEDGVARQALELARARASEPREGHVGYYLVDEGFVALVSALGGRPPRWMVPSRRRQITGLLYSTGIVLFAGLLIAFFGLLLAGPWLPLLLSLTLVPAVGVAVALVNRIAGQLVATKTLPRLDVRRGIPERFRTLVAVPALLESKEVIHDLVRTLETNYRANSDPMLSFALVSDFSDAATERTERDEPLLAEARNLIRQLNRKYESDGSGPFLLLHRSRRWNPKEERWMGWERKRGKLTELNRLLLGRPSGLWLVEGNGSRIEGVPFVLTVDADTRLPRDAAARLVGTLAHPLNRPEIAPDGRTSRGYSVLQPRLEILPDADGGSRFSRIYGGVQGLDLYAHAAFDVYQDLFDVGIFAGKGIYDVRAFEASLEDRTPDNSLLSHDLFEGAHGRAGLVADLILLEDFPEHPLSYARRAHRWIRGDWQLVPWLFPRVPGERGGGLPNRLTRLSRWMIVDNLRRSVQPPAVLLLLVLGWLLSPETAVSWTLALAGVIGFPFLIGSLDALLRWGQQFPRRADLGPELRALRRALGRWAMDLTFLPYEAWNHTDAIVRTLHRVYVSKKRLLEWATAAAVARAIGKGSSLGYFFRHMWQGPALAAASAALLAALAGSPPLAALPILAFWAVSPLVARWSALRPRRAVERPGVYPPAAARTLARRVWGFYLRFQGPERHWLAPDHFQEEPGPVVAERTSPTNLAMALVSTVAAWDLGFLGTPRFVTRLRNMVEGMRRLTRYRGHFLNWYDTVSLEPLHPLYVSTVDSGNLATSFVVTWETLREAHERPLWTRDGVDGLLDTVRVIEEVIVSAARSGFAQAFRVECRALQVWMERNLLDSWEAGFPAFVATLHELSDRKLAELESFLVRAGEDSGEAVATDWGPAQSWVVQLRSDVEQTLDEILLLMPWLAARFREHPEALRIQGRLAEAAKGVPSLRRLEWFLIRERKGDARAGTGTEWDLGVELEKGLERALSAVRMLRNDARALVSQLEAWHEEMDFKFLYDRRRDLFRIGFSVSAGALDPNHYDLLASESRAASAVAMSKGDAPPAHWLHLGRPFAWTDHGPVLMSWSGTMFEYLMPALFFRMPPETVLEEACRRAVKVQRDYGRRFRVPWGVSESGYHVLNSEDHYQYRAFGVPDLGLNRTLGRRLVIAPYASLMATPLEPGAVFENVQALAALGGIGAWGPYEALDFGPSADRSKRPTIVRSYMCHHQGMILAALANHLTGNRIVERFHRDPRIGTVEPYLHERIPWRRTVERTWIDRTAPLDVGRATSGVRTWSPPLRRTPPVVHHLTNGELTVTLGIDGRGGSRWRGWSVVRGGLGAGMLPGGPYVVLMDRGTKQAWSPLPDPQAPLDEDQEVLLAPHRAEYMRKTRDIRARMTAVVSPEPSVEVRRVSFWNESTSPRRLRLAISAEVALAPIEDDLRHPAFHKLFVRAEPLPGGEGLLFERRRRKPTEEPPVALVSLLGPVDSQKIKWGTSREAFMGRGRTAARPAALDDPSRVDGSPGPHHPLDPMASAIVDFELGPWGEATFTLLTAVGPDRPSALRAASEFRFPRRREWAEVQARSRAEGELVHLGAAADDPSLWEELLAHVLHPAGMERIDSHTAATLDLTQASLWRWGVSGDVPFILVENEGFERGPVLSELLAAQRWWRARGVPVDVVVVSRGAGEYFNAARERIVEMLSTGGAEAAMGRPGGVHIVRGEDVDDAERVRLRTLSAFKVDAAGTSLRSQLPTTRAATRAGFAPPVAREARGARDAVLPLDGEKAVPRDGPLGAFEPATGDYVIDLGPGDTTPVPWVNIVAREGIGFVVTESGGSFTWGDDAGEFRLTPWHNDPVLGLRGEVLYLKDEDRHAIWTPAPGPLGLSRSHRVHHGWGRSVLESRSEGLEERVTWCLHPTLPAKIVKVRLRNMGSVTRRMSATYFADWVLGSHALRTVGRLQVRFDRALSAIVVRNPYLPRFSRAQAFLAADRGPDGMATDREEFLGSEEPLDAAPDGLLRGVPGEREVPRRQGCGALKTNLTLAPGETGEVSFYLGVVGEGGELDRTLADLRERTDIDPSDEARQAWDGYLRRVRVRTPDRALDHLLNGWLPYQTIVSRLYGRTGFYQSGGAFGYRDQLQDVYALLPLDPALACAHLVQAARRQFSEGDVLHWWHPGTTRGVRTKCSDDLLWLPWVLAQTVSWTGDATLLDRRVPFLHGPPIPEGESELYDAFAPSGEEGSLWDHALRAVERVSRLLSPRGLPLMGTGDWNDGMDRVGREGRGESIWLGWFFIDVCRLLIPLARERGDDHMALRLEAWRATVREAIETHGWDGEWYRRAFFDSGEPLGARESVEARIDSIAQSWGVISEGADPLRARMALDAAWRDLVRVEDQIVLLLTPPFEGSGPDPGYIAAYPPGVRENGGQYTHAAAWLARAFAKFGDGERVGRILRSLLPSRHAGDRASVERYRVEPYVVAADVYGEEPHLGRGGWTWYTGSAGWIWRVALEDVLGVRRQGRSLRIDPCIPPDWEGFELRLVVEDVRVVVRVTNPDRVARGVRSCTADGRAVDAGAIPLPIGPASEATASTEPTREVIIEVTLGRPAS
jgi:cyclic beta-1,2-glucan synthetase